MSQFVTVLGRIVLLLAVVMGSFIFWAYQEVKQKRYEPKALDVHLPKLANDPDLVLGERIARIRGGCVDCHGENFAGKLVLNDGATAIVHGSNITPASLKDWQDADYVRAIKHCVGQDARALVLMPCQDYQHLSAADLQALIAYLKALPAVDRPNGPVKLGPIFTLLLATGRLPSFLPYFIVQHAAGFPEKPAEGPNAEFGAYLARAACSGCHGSQYAGGKIPGGDPSWPEASDIRSTRLLPWGFEGFMRAMRTGQNPQGAPIRAPMPIHLTAQMSEEELSALWRFLSEKT